MTEPDISIQVEEVPAGVTMRIVVQPRQTNGTELFMFWGSVLCAFSGVVALFQGGDAVVMGLLFGGIGFFGLVLSFWNRNRVWRGSDTLYSFTCENGVATFTRDDFVQTYELANLSHIWFKERTYYWQPIPLDLMVKRGTSELFVFSILEVTLEHDELWEFKGLVNAYLRGGES